MGLEERSRVHRALPWDLDIRSVQFFFFLILRSLESSLKWDWLLEAGYQELGEGGGRAVRFSLETPPGWKGQGLLNESTDHQTPRIFQSLLL